MRWSIVLLLATAAWGDTVPPSPRIDSLKEALRQRKSGAVEAFCAEVAANGGTPLIECPAALARDCLTTFLWRGGAATGNVLVRAEAVPGAPAEHVFQHLADTDIWYRSYRFRNDARLM